MGFFSGILDTVKDVVGAISDPIGAVTDLASSVLGVASPFMEQQSTAAANRQNIALSREQMAWQQQQNQKAMDFSAEQAGVDRGFQRNEAQTARRFNQYMADQAMDFSERMSSTAYQRTVKDLAAAGLNPMLAYMKGGASSPVGVSASSPLPSGRSAGGISSAGSMARVTPEMTARSISTAAQVAQTVQAARAARANVANIRADTANKLAQAGNIAAETRLKNLMGTTEGFKPGKVIADTAVSKATEKRILDTLLPTLDQIRADVARSQASAEQTRSSNVLMKALMNNAYLKDWAPYLLDIFRPGR